MSYYSEWRHIQLLAIKKKLDNRYSFYSDIVEKITYSDNTAGEKTIAQEIQNGLMFEAIQHSIQYIEDLFALINAAKKPDFFIRSIINYKAGKIDNAIKSFSIKKKDICESFHFPYYPDSDYETEKEIDILKVTDEGIIRLADAMVEIIEFYKKYQYFYNQYKHGLSIALRPYTDYTEDIVNADKLNAPHQSPIVALDSLNFKDAPKNQYGYTGYLLMPCFSETIRPHINFLQSENNLLRFVMSPPDLNIENVLVIAKKTKRAIQLLISNFLQVINDENPLKLRLPAPEDEEVYEFNIDVVNSINTQ